MKPCASPNLLTHLPFSLAGKTEVGDRKYCNTLRSTIPTGEMSREDDISLMRSTQHLSQGAKENCQDQN